jgi:hypothetical protein
MVAFLAQFVCILVFVKSYIVIFLMIPAAGVVSYLFFNHEQRKVVGYFKFQMQNRDLWPNFSDKKFFWNFREFECIKKITKRNKN